MSFLRNLPRTAIRGQESSVFYNVTNRLDPGFHRGDAKNSIFLLLRANKGRIDHGFGDSFLNFLIIFGIKKEKTKRPTEKNTLKESN